MNPRRLVSLVALLLAYAASHVAEQGFYTTLWIDRAGRGEPIAAVTWTASVVQILSLVGMVAAGGLGFLVGPRATAALGALVATIGHAALLAAPGDDLGAGLVTFGAGVFFPCFAAAAADAFAADEESSDAPRDPAVAFDGRRAARVVVVVTLTLALSRVATMIGTAGIGFLSSSLGARAAHLAMTIASGGALALATMSDLVERLGAGVRGADGTGGGPYRARAARSARGDASPSTPFLAPIAALAGLSVVVVAAGHATIRGAATAAFSSASVALAYSLQSVVFLMAAVVVAAVVSTLARGTSTWLPLVVAGAGCALLALGVALAGVGIGAAQAALFFAGGAVIAVGQAMTSAVPASYAAVSVRPRLATLAVAGIGVVGQLASTAVFWLVGTPAIGIFITGAVAIGCAGAAVALVGVGRVLHARLVADAVGADPGATPER